MNKILIYAKKTVIAINLLLMLYLILNLDYFCLDFKTTSNFIIFCSMIAILSKMEIVMKMDFDLKYNVSFLIVQVIIAFIIIRNLFDPNMFLGIDDLNMIGDLEPKINSFFLINNFIYLNMMNLGLVVYAYINKKHDY